MPPLSLKEQCIIMDIDCAELERRVAITALEKGYTGDIHTKRAIEIFQVPEKEITKEMRDFAKNTNYSEMYNYMRKEKESE